MHVHPGPCDTASYLEAGSTDDSDRLLALAKHPEHWIRSRVANNPHITVSEFLILAEDPHPTVRANFATRKELPLDVVLAIEARAQPLGDAGLLDMIQASLASRRNCPEAHMWRLFATQRFGVLISLVHNPSTPQALGEALGRPLTQKVHHDPKEVRELAAKRWPVQQPPD